MGLLLMHFYYYFILKYFWIRFLILLKTFFSYKWITLKEFLQTVLS